MRKLVIGVALLMGCRSTTTVIPVPAAPTAPTGGSVTGAAGAREAVAMFMDAVKAEDLQAISAVWGTEKGPVRDQMDRQDMDKREIIMTKCLRHESYKILEETASINGTRKFSVQVVRQGATAMTTFAVTQGPGGRWYVLSVDPGAASESVCSTNIR